MAAQQYCHAAQVSLDGGYRPRYVATICFDVTSDTCIHDLCEYVIHSVHCAFEHGLQSKVRADDTESLVSVC